MGSHSSKAYPVFVPYAVGYGYRFYGSTANEYTEDQFKQFKNMFNDMNKDSLSKKEFRNYWSTKPGFEHIKPTDLDILVYIFFKFKIN